METPCLCCSFLFTFFPHPSVGYFPLNADVHKPPKWALPMAYRSSGTAPAWVLFTRYNASGADCSSMGPPRDRFPDKNLLFMDCFSWATAPSPGWPSPERALHRVTGNTCLLLCGVLHGLQGGYLLLLSSPCTAGKSLLWHLEHLLSPLLH